MRWRSVFIFVGRILSECSPCLSGCWFPHREWASPLGAFDLVFELIVIGSEILALRLRTPDLPLLLTRPGAGPARSP